MRYFIFTLFLVSQIGTASWSRAATAPLCSQIFTAVEIPWGSLRPDFKHETHYTKEIPQDTAIKNQCNLGTCHLHSWLAFIEKRYTQQTGDVITLSNQYESAQIILDRALWKLSTPDNDASISLGSGPLASRDSILNFGVIPEGLWQPKTEFFKNPNAQKFTEYLENIIARSKWQASKAETPSEKEKALKQGEEQIRKLFQGVVGDLPEQFQWNGKTWTPQEFAKTYFSFFDGPQTQMLIQADRKASERTEKINADTKIFTDINTVEKKAAELIDKGEMIFLAYEHHAEYVDKTTGIMSIRAFYIPDYAKPLTREMREAFKKNDGGHAVQIIGYERDLKTGQIIKWKIKNSWGTQSGDEGYYHMYNDYFRAFAKSLAYPSQ